MSNAKINVGNDANEMRDAADPVYRRRFAEKAKAASYFAAVTYEAQHISGHIAEALAT